MRKNILLLALASLCDSMTSLFAGVKNPVPMANEIAPGKHHGSISFLTDSAVSTRNLLCKQGSDSSHVAISGAGDFPRGVMTDEASAAEIPIAVDCFGINPSTKIVVASGVIAANAELVPAANGKVQALPTAPGTYRVVGVSLKGASADGEEMEIIPCYPTPRTVT